MTLPIKTLLQNLIQTQSSWKTQLLENWPTIVGPLAEHVTIEKIYEDTLLLGVSDSCWLQELYLLSHTILTTINQSLDQARIKQLRFKQVPYKRKQTKEPFNREIKKEESKRVLTRNEQVALNRIKDTALKESLEAFLMRCHKERS